jgi:hypothetical protein
VGRPHGGSRRVVTACVVIVALLCLAGAAPALAAGGLGTGGPQVTMTGMQCATPGDCTAIGIYYDALGHGQGFGWTEANGHWSAGVELQPPSNAAGNPFDLYNDDTGLTAVSCPAAGDCTAVGDYLDSTGNVDGVVFNEKGGAWQKGVEVRLPSGALRASSPSGLEGGIALLSGVSCWAVGDCAAAGGYLDNGGDIDGLLAYENNGSWSRGSKVPVPTGVGPVRNAGDLLTAISCVSPGTCNAAGSYTDSSSNGQGWLVTEASGAITNDVTSVAPTSPDTAAKNPSPSFSAISCFDATDCGAAGSYNVDVSGTSVAGNGEGLLLSEVGGSWNPGVEAALPTGAAPDAVAEDQDAQLLSISCTGAQDCTAVGYYADNLKNIQGVLLTESGGTWTSTAVPLPGNASQNQLGVQTVLTSPVSCSSPGYCLAASVYNNSVDNELPLIATETNGTWTPTEMTPPPNASPVQEIGGLSGASCPLDNGTISSTNSDCTVVGQYQDTSGDFEGYGINQSTVSGDWGSSTAMKVPGATLAELRLSLNAALTPTGKDATISHIAKVRGFTFRYTAIRRGKLTIHWYARHHGKLRLIGHGTASPGSAVGVSVKVHITSLGRTLLKGAKKLTVTARVAFVPATGASAHTTKKFALHK